MKKTIIVLAMLAIMVPAAGLRAAGNKGKADERLDEMEQRLQHMEQMLESLADNKQLARGRRKGHGKCDLQDPKQRCRQIQQQMNEWFEQLEDAYQQKDMEKIGGLIEDSKEMREQMQQCRGQMRKCMKQMRKSRHSRGRRNYSRQRQYRNSEYYGGTRRYRGPKPYYQPDDWWD